MNFWVKMKKAWRQGDIIIVEDSYIPENFIEVEQLTIKSETGKNHTVSAEKIFVPCRGEFREAYVVSNKEIKVEHPEHGTLRIPPGCYRIYGVREFEGRSLYGRSRHVLD